MREILRISKVWINSSENIDYHYIAYVLDEQYSCNGYKRKIYRIDIEDYVTDENLKLGSKALDLMEDKL